MGMLSDQAKVELLNALGDKRSGVFMINGKLISIEVENFESDPNDDKDIQALDIAQEIEEYQELKESLQRYLADPEMKRYTADQLKEKRGEKRI